VGAFNTVAVCIRTNGSRVPVLQVLQCVVQPVPWKMRLEMLNYMVIEILNAGEISVN